MNIEMYTTNLKNLAENGRLVETYDSKGTEYFIAEYPISGDELNNNITAIQEYWTEKEGVLHFGVFIYFDTSNIENVALLSKVVSCEGHSFNSDKLYHICVESYVRRDKYGFETERGFYKVSIMEDGEDFYKWYSQPVFNHDTIYGQYQEYLGNWEKENLPENIRRWIEFGREYYGDMIEEMIDECGYPVDVESYPLYFGEWLEQKFYKL